MEPSLIKDIALSDSGFIFNPVTGESFTVNPIGVGILNQLRLGKARQEILDQLVVEFQVDLEQAERDLMDFLNLLKHFRLVSSNE
ncbi:MAG: PqqD family protein [Bacteroidetes bacterium]|nr:PqqD family protein [Bacteroidota bacterium]